MLPYDWVASTSGSTSVAPPARIARAARVSVQPVTTWSSTSSTGPAGFALERVAAADGGDPLRGVHRALARLDRRVGDRPASDDRLLEEPGQPVGQVGDQGRPARRLHDHDAVDPGPPVVEHLEHGLHQGGRHRLVGRPARNRSRSACPWPRSVSRATARPSAAPSAILPLSSMPRLASAVGHIFRGSTTTPGRDSRASASSSAGRHLGRHREPATVVAATAVGRLRVVELVTQEPHPAPVGGEVVEHRLLLALAGLGHPSVALLVVDPLPAGRLPAATDPAYGAVDVEHLEHRLQPGAVELDVRLQRGRAHRATLGGQHLDGLPYQLLAGNASEPK